MSGTPLFWTLRAIARLERVGDLRPARLSDPELARWHRYRRKLGWRDLIAILHEDLAGPFPVPFDLGRWDEDPLSDLTEEVAQGLISAARAEDERDTLTFLKDAAQGLGLPAGGRIADLPKVQPHHRVLELPGSGGRIAAHQALRKDLEFGQAFTFVADTDAERIAIGLAAVELRANEPTIRSSGEVRALSSESGGLDCCYGVRCPQGAAAVEGLDVAVRWS